MNINITPGPWSYTVDFNRSEHVHTFEAHGPAMLDIGSLTNEADARAISAVPEMLDALVSANQEIIFEGCRYYLLGIEDRDEALKKAGVME